MEQNFQTSFIPKKPMVEERARVSRPIGLLTIISIVILFAVVILSGGLYFYKGVMAKNIEDSKASLDKAKNRFEPSKITELELLDRRLQASNEVLSNHIAISPIFQMLEHVTMKTIRFTKFSYAVGMDKKVDVKMSGLALGYGAVALQSDLFAKDKNFIDPAFSNLTLDNNGNVLFDLEFSVDPSDVNYKKMLSAAATAPTIPESSSPVINSDNSATPVVPDNGATPSSPVTPN